MIEHLRREMASGSTSSEEITTEYLDRIAQHDDEIHAFISVTRKAALAQAREQDARRRRGDPLGPLSGIPVAIKDNICLKGSPTTCGSRMLEGFIPPYDATVARKLCDAGAVLLGKTNLDEFAMGSTTESSYFGPTRNPWDVKRIPGGSSGGSAACVASGEAPLALGSDTGGSIRQPASHCGVVGMKPTYGRVSRYGLVAFASSLDQIGPIGNCVEDTAGLLQVIAGHDPLDSTSIDRPVPDFGANLKAGVEGLRIGVPGECFGEGLDERLRELILGKIEGLKREGADIKDVSLPHLEYAVATYYILCTAEASSNLARYDGVKYGFRFPQEEDLKNMYAHTRQHGFGQEVKRRIMLGTYVLSSGYYDAYYGKASKVRTLIANDYRRAWEECDLIVSPVTPALPFRIGETLENPLQVYLSDVYTVSANLAGLPAISVPCGKIEGIPVGIQLTAPLLKEAVALQGAWALENL